MRRHLKRLVLCLGLWPCGLTHAAAHPEPDRLLLQDPSGAASREPSRDQPSREPAHRLALGVSYLGGQAQWHWTRHWATEFQFQHGTASSDFGDVTANVFGLRVCRYFRSETRMPFYVGPEIAYAEAEAQNSSYRTSGVVAGAFAGFDYYVMRRLSVGIDIGPYVISLKEQQTGLTQTSLDFVLNTTVNWHLF